MDTVKTKNVIILLLFIANLYFLYNFYVLREKTMTVPQKTIEDTVEIINARAGCEIIDKNVIPREKPFYPILDIEYAESDFDRLISNIAEIPSGGELLTHLLPGYVKSVAAGRYRFYFGNADADGYFLVSIIDTDYKAASAEGNEQYIFSEDILEEWQERLHSGELPARKNTGIVKKAVSAFIKKSGSSIQDFEVLYAGVAADGSTVAIAAQKFGGLAVNSHLAYIEIKGGEVVFFSGKWYFGGSGEQGSVPLLDSVNILFKSLETDASMYAEGQKIISISGTYSVRRHESEKFYLLPVWRIDFEGGRRFYYNMVSGEKLTGIAGG